MSMEVYRYIIYVGSSSIIFPLLLIFSRTRKLNFEFRLLAILLVISAGADLISFTIPKYGSLASNIYTLLEFPLITGIILRDMKLKYYGKIILVSFILFAIVMILDFYYLSTFDERNITLRLINGFWFMAVAFSYFYRQLDNPQVDKISTSPMFWVVLAVFIYFSANIFVYASDVILSNESMYKIYIPIHSSLQFTRNALIAIGISKYRDYSNS